MVVDEPYSVVAVTVTSPIVTDVRATFSSAHVRDVSYAWFRLLHTPLYKSLFIHSTKFPQVSVAELRNSEEEEEP